MIQGSPARLRRHHGVGTSRGRIAVGGCAGSIAIACAEENKRVSRLVVLACTTVGRAWHCSMLSAAQQSVLAATPAEDVQGELHGFTGERRR